MNTVTFKTDNLRSLVSFMNEDERKSLVIDGIPIDMQKQVITVSCKDGLEIIRTFEEALNEENAYVKSMANEIIGEIRNAGTGNLPPWVDGKHIQWFNNKDEVIRYIEANIKRETDAVVQFNGITSQGPEMKYDEFKKLTSKFVFKDNDSPDWNYKLSDWEKVQLFQLFPVVKFIGIFKVNEAKRFLNELN